MPHGIACCVCGRKNRVAFVTHHVGLRGRERSGGTRCWILGRHYGDVCGVRLASGARRRSRPPLICSRAARIVERVKPSRVGESGQQVPGQTAKEEVLVHALCDELLSQGKRGRGVRAIARMLRIVYIAALDCERRYKLPSHGETPAALDSINRTIEGSDTYDREVVESSSYASSGPARSGQLFQTWPDHRTVYLESCPNQVRLVYGVTFPAAKQGWTVLGELLNWRELSLDQARRMQSISVRNIQPHMRYGKHMLIPEPSLRALLDAMARIRLDERELDSAFRESRFAIRPGARAAPTAIVTLPQLPSAGQRTVHVRCINAAGHRHGDRNPSLIMWMNKDGKTGGAMCAVCRQKNEPSRPLTFAVQYKDQRQAWLFEPGQRHSARAQNRKAKHETRLEKSQRRDQRSASSSVQAVVDNHPAADEHENDSSGDEKLSGAGIAQVDGRTKSKSPVGGHVMKAAQVDGMYIGCALRTRSVDGECKLHRTIGSALKGSLIDILLSSERRSSSERQELHAQEVQWLAVREEKKDNATNVRAAAEPYEHAQSDLKLPTRILSVSVMKPSAWRALVRKPRLPSTASTSTTGSNSKSPDGASPRVPRAPASWKPVAQEWVLFDLDDIRGFEDPTQKERIARVASGMLAVIRRDVELSGRCVVIQTGPCGFQLWAELREPRRSPRDWFAQDSVRSWYRATALRLLQAARAAGASEGHVDMSACAAGRFGRRPSWRILASGHVYRSRVVAVAAQRVASRSVRD
ncbi:hypothetical protein FVE85_2744 [Porphyridium purpureum]|uniref:Uncharacterized protein n=1 Tax=Porphyridium purpureum TaxID=35688 RepID=A0A5J4YUR8_PORPP|nr:hypothetical protein FVE85_2744 [Porphyridium purpureum]|eukprot:POR2170..scf227_4